MAEDPTMAPGPVPRTIAQLADLAKVNFDPTVPLIRWVRAASLLAQQAKIYDSEGDYDTAFVYLCRAAKICLDHVPTHPDYLTLGTRGKMSIESSAYAYMDALGPLKLKLARRYDDQLRSALPSNASTTSLEKPASAPPSPGASPGTSWSSSSTSQAASHSKSLEKFRNRHKFTRASDGLPQQPARGPGPPSPSNASSSSNEGWELVSTPTTPTAPGSRPSLHSARLAPTAHRPAFSGPSSRSGQPSGASRHKPGGSLGGLAWPVGLGEGAGERMSVAFPGAGCSDSDQSRAPRSNASGRGAIQYVRPAEVTEFDPVAARRAALSRSVSRRRSSPPFPPADLVASRTDAETYPSRGPSIEYSAPAGSASGLFRRTSGSARDAGSPRNGRLGVKGSPHPPGSASSRAAALAGPPGACATEDPESRRRKLSLTNLAWALRTGSLSGGPDGAAKPTDPSTKSGNSNPGTLYQFPAPGSTVVGSTTAAAGAAGSRPRKVSLSSLALSAQKLWSKANNDTPARATGALTKASTVAAAPGSPASAPSTPTTSRPTPKSAAFASAAGEESESASRLTKAHLDAQGYVPSEAGSVFGWDPHAPAPRSPSPPRSLPLPPQSGVNEKEDSAIEGLGIQYRKPEPASDLAPMSSRPSQSRTEERRFPNAKPAPLNGPATHLTGPRPMPGPSTGSRRPSLRNHSVQPFPTTSSPTSPRQTRPPAFSRPLQTSIVAPVPTIRRLGHEGIQRWATPPPQARPATAPARPPKILASEHPPLAPPANNPRTPAPERACAAPAGSPERVDQVEKEVAASGRNLTEGGIELRSVICPEEVMGAFVALAIPGTDRGVETCGLLLGILKHDTFRITTLLMPKQTATADTCTTTNEEEVFEIQDSKGLMTLGWIHTHPTQTCFMSSLDLHTHASYQLMLAEAVAIVCSPSKHPSVGIFRLTDPPGLQTITACNRPGAFHPHPEGVPIYTDADAGHIRVTKGLPLDIIDMRPDP